MSDDESTRGPKSRRGKTRRGMSTWVQESAFACCCVGFLNPRGEGSKAYYTLLGLPKNATLADVKKAYKKLSLAHHPDKLAQRGQTLTEEMQEEFRKIKQAYEVLSDPPRRRTYDRFGENGLLLMEDGPGAFLGSPTKMQEILRAADTRAHCVVLSVFLLVLSYIVAVPVLFGLRVDGHLGSAPFALIFLPLWLVEALMLAAMTTSVAQGPSVRPPELKEDEKWEDEDPLYLRQMSLAIFSIYLLAQAVVVAKLDNGLGDAPWLVVLVPYYFYEGALLASMWHAKKEANRAAATLQEEAAQKASKSIKGGDGDDSDDEEAAYNRPDEMGFEELMGAEEKRQEAASIVPTMFYHGVRLLQVFLIALQVDGWLLPQDMNGAWWVVLLPALQYATSQFFGCYISTKHAKTVAKEAAELSQAPLPDPPTVQNMAEREFNKHRANQKAEFHASMAQAALCSGLCLALYAMLLGFYLAPPEDAFSFFWFYFPVGVLIGCPLCMLLTGAACELGGCIVDEDDNDDEDYKKAAALVIEPLESAIKEAKSKEDCDLDAPFELPPKLGADLQSLNFGFDPSQGISVRLAESLLTKLKEDAASSAAAAAADAGGGEHSDVEAPPPSASDRQSLSAEALSAMSVKELKAMAASKGLSTSGCTEKSEIVALLVLGQSPSPSSSSSQPQGSKEEVFATELDASRLSTGKDTAPLLAVAVTEDAWVVEPSESAPPEPEEDIGDID